MIKTIIRIGNSQGIIFEAALMELARLKTGDYLNWELHTGGVMIFAPLHLSVNSKKLPQLLAF